MHTWIKRSLGVAAITGGVLLAGAATAHADDGSRPSTSTVSVPVEISGVSIELGRSEHTSGAAAPRGCGCEDAPAPAPSSSSERSGLDVEVGRTTTEPTVRLGGSGSDRPAVEVEAPVDVEKVEAELGSSRSASSSGSGGTTTHESERGLDVEVGELTTDPAVRAGDHDGLDVTAPTDLENIEAELGQREHTSRSSDTGTTTHESERGLDVEVGELTTDPAVRAGDHDGLDVTAPTDLEKIEAELGQREHTSRSSDTGSTTHESERGLDVEVGELTTSPALRAGDEDGLLVDLPVALDGLDLGLGQRETRTSDGTDTTTSTSESGLGIELGDLALDPVVGIGGQDGLLVDLPVSLDGIELGLGSRESSTTTPGGQTPVPGGETPAPGEPEPGTPAPMPEPPAPVTPVPGDEPGRGGDDRPSTGTTGPAPAPTAPSPGTTPGTVTPGTTIPGTMPGTTPGTGTVPGDRPAALWPDGLLDALLRTVVGDLGRLVQDVADELTADAPFVTDPGSTPGTETPRPTQPVPGDDEEPGTGGTPPAEGPDCGCAEEPETLPEVDDTVGTVTDAVTDTTRGVTEVVDTVVETTTETVSDVVDTVTDVVDGVVDTGLGGSAVEDGGQDDGDC